MYSLPIWSLNEFEDEIIDSEDYVTVDPNPVQFSLTEIHHLNIAPEISMENVGNILNSQINTEPNRLKLKETQNTAIQVQNSIIYGYTETLAIFNRINSKIVSSYLGQISSPERKSSKKAIQFDKCDLFNNLQLESSFTTLKQVINRCEFQFTQKSNLLSFLDSHYHLRVFLSNSLSSGYEQINNDFIYFVFDVVQELKTIIYSSQEKTHNLQCPVEFESKEKDKQRPGSLEKEKLMKKQLQEVGFFERIFYEKTIRYLNCQLISCPVSDDKIKVAFIRFSRLYSHLIIKLIILDIPVSESRKNLISMKRMNSCGEKLSEMKKQGMEVKSKNSVEIFGNWPSNSGIAKSFNSINSLGSINWNNLSDIKIYSSKHDLWSEADEENYCNFSDDELEDLDKDT